MDGDVSPASAALFEHVYIVGTGCFLPGAPVDNDCIDRFIAPLDRKSDRIKRRVLRDNGIRTRHYAIDEAGRHSSRAGNWPNTPLLTPWRRLP